MLISKASESIFLYDDEQLGIEEKRKSNLNKDSDLFHGKLEGVYTLKNLTAIKTDSDDEYLVPNKLRENFVQNGIVTEMPDDIWRMKYWKYAQYSGSKFVGNIYKIKKKFQHQQDDTNLVTLAKRTMNQLIPLQLKVSSRSDRRSIRERMKEIRQNRLSEKQFFNLMNQLQLNIDMTVTRDNNQAFRDGIKAISENII